MKFKDQIRNYIFNNFLFDKPNDWLKDDQSFLESGVIDSSGVLELVMFLEETFNIKVQDEDLTPINLDSVQKLSNFIQKKKERELIAA